MSTLTLLRHGQAAFGSEHYDQLSPLGLAQAQATAAFFAERSQRFDQVWIGPRVRHRLTAEAALSSLQPVSIEGDEGLDEFAEGSQVLRAAERRTGLAILSNPDLPRRERLRLYAEEIERWAQGGVEMEDVRSIATFRNDVTGWLRRATTRAASGREVLAVTSAGVIAAIVCAVTNQPDAAIGGYIRVLQNASLTTFLFSDRGIALQSFNTTAHLPAALLSAI